MASLRDFVTGSDNCSAGDGAGPSNAAASLADALLGGGSKQQAQLHELPGHHLPGPSFAPGPYQPLSAVQAAEGALSTELPAIPGLGPSAAVQSDVDAFLRGYPQRSGAQHPQSELFTEFDTIYGAAAASPGSLLHHPPDAATALGNAAVTPFFQAFFNSSKAQLPFQPTNSVGPPIDLSVPDKCRIRDRSTILARHVFADRGNEFADQQVSVLLHSLNINPAELPVNADPAAWDKIYSSNVTGNLAATEHASASAMVSQNGFVAEVSGRPPPAGWLEDFENLRLDTTNKVAVRDTAGVVGPSGAWAEEFQQETDKSSWVDEFKTATEQGSLTRQALRSGDALEQTKKLADTLAANKDPKFQNSQFLQFVSKMSRGEIILEDNQAKEVPKQAAEWANEFTTSAAPSVWGEEFASFQANQYPGMSGQHWANDFQQQQQKRDENFDTKNDWASEFASGLTSGGEWAEEFSAGARGPLSTDAAAWEEEYLKELENLHSVMGPRSAGEYVMSEDNPFLLDIDSYSTGKELFRRGLLSEAVLALEAECQRNPNNSEAWRLLGTVQAENDDDRQAIAAMNRALAADPNNLEALLSLGVSHTNELDQREALIYLRQWLLQHHAHGEAARQLEGPLDSSQLLSNTVRMFAGTARHHPQDGDVQVALGVLCNLSRQYDEAVLAFKAALALRPQDYSLWNKLGATLANSGRSGEAVSAYQKALELKPNYMRAWTNMGISLANLGDYEGSARYYVRALALNPQASAVWGYLQTTLACLGVLEQHGNALDAKDVKLLQQAYPL